MKVHPSSGLKSPKERALDFLSQAHLYDLGRLPTEGRHPKTHHLAEWAQSNLSQAIKVLHEVDHLALKSFALQWHKLKPLAKAIQRTLTSKHKIYLAGCGATGRLALSLEYMWRCQHEQDPHRVVAFMAGGDVALVHSLEGFEDDPRYGAEQLVQLGFQEGDLLIALTEGGETPFVIGVAEQAVALSPAHTEDHYVFFLHCNPEHQLCELVERSKQVLIHPRIHSISWAIGPMALSGSTRMQASTILELAVGLALFLGEDFLGHIDRVERWLQTFIEIHESLPIGQLQPFIESESAVYQKGNQVLYSVDDLAITVFTDTTERAPTFSWPPLNNQYLPRAHHSPVYLMIPQANHIEESWKKLLCRSPRVLNWSDRDPKTTLQYLYGFDFSREAEKYRRQVLPEFQHEIFKIGRHLSYIQWHFMGHKLSTAVTGLGLLADHLILKMQLNIHSTLLMGRLGRYVSNVMTYVYPTNGKLIDRARRYVRWLLEDGGHMVQEVTEETLLAELFHQMDHLQAGESVVLKTVQALRSS